MTLVAHSSLVLQDIATANLYAAERGSNHDIYI